MIIFKIMINVNNDYVSMCVLYKVWTLQFAFMVLLLINDAIKKKRSLEFANRNR